MALVGEGGGEGNDFRRSPVEDCLCVDVPVATALAIVLLMSFLARRVGGDDGGDTGVTIRVPASCLVDLRIVVLYASGTLCRLEGCSSAFSLALVDSLKRGDADEEEALEVEER